VLYRLLGLQTLYVMEPVLIQRILLDDAESYSKQPLNDDVFGEVIGGGLLNAEEGEWRWQRRLAAPLFRAEEMLRYVPAFQSACAPLFKRWRESGAGATQRIDRHMTGATLQALQDTVLWSRARRGRPPCAPGGGGHLPLLFNVESGAHLVAAAAVDSPSRSLGGRRRLERCGRSPRWEGSRQEFSIGLL
jgi:Cytochrome P450